MKLGLLVSIASCSLSLFSCSRSSTIRETELIAFDSLWREQVSALAEAKAELTKEVLMNGAVEKKSFIPKDTTAWMNELEIFQQLRAINKPVNIDSYVETISDDSLSNLKIRSLVSQKEIPLKELRVYYLNTQDKIRRIEAVINERNALYKSARTLSLTFSELNNKTILTSYSIQGGQHMILGDTVQFDIQSTIHIQ